MATAKKRKYSASAREDILAAAADLIYENGFAATDIKQILERSGSHKASFYQHFGSMEAIGAEYLRAKEALLLERLKYLGSESANFEDFIQGWSAQIRAALKQGRFRGCEFANFAAQALGYPSLEKEVRRIVSGWEKSLERYLESEKESRRIGQLLDSRTAARKIIALYEGCAQLLAITGDKGYLKIFEKECLRIVRVEDS